MERSDSFRECKRFDIPLKISVDVRVIAKWSLPLGKGGSIQLAKMWEEFRNVKLFTEMGPSGAVRKKELDYRAN